ncbi:MAG TPA: serine hydrolase [Thermomicrobiales bacterium]|nr:serine hydrolase [Thermomicrobiales bacterium]
MADWSGVEEVIAGAERVGVSIGVAVIGPDGDVFSHRGDDGFLSASTIKIAIMIALFRKIERGEVSLDDTYVLRAEDKVQGSGVLQNLHDGIELTIGDVVYLMISISDNPATNILINLVGMENVNATMRDLGMTRSVLGRPMRGRLANAGEAENEATPNEFARMVQSILDRKAASPESCDQMIELLKLQQNARRIGRYVPEGVEWGSKTGSYSTVVNDVGFVRTDAGTVIVSVFMVELPDLVTGEQIIGDVAKAAMQATGVVG